MAVPLSLVIFTAVRIKSALLDLGLLTQCAVDLLTFRSCALTTHLSGPHHFHFSQKESSRRRRGGSSPLQSTTPASPLIKKTQYKNSDSRQLECSAPVSAADHCQPVGRLLSRLLGRILIKSHVSDANVCCRCKSLFLGQSGTRLFLSDPPPKSCMILLCSSFAPLPYIIADLWRLTTQPGQTC